MPAVLNRLVVALSMVSGPETMVVLRDVRHPPPAARPEPRKGGPPRARKAG